MQNEHYLIYKAPVVALKPLHSLTTFSHTLHASATTTERVTRPYAGLGLNPLHAHMQTLIHHEPLRREELQLNASRFALKLFQTPPLEPPSLA